ncbi:hypothetical protein FOL46_001663 [Perkinsus olseni]|uniref:Uncharacterized protein n=1 Tax=Perkinsus olseni TaxID=32597 RepID=A0A7J6KST8_PEROL|nr:hypothetical protein FOL46_001663 [Perkinsus olseni]
MVDNATAVTITPSALKSLDETKGFSTPPGAAHPTTPPKTYREPKSFVSPTVASTINSSSPRHVSFDNYVGDHAVHHDTVDGVMDHEELSDVLNRLLPSLDCLNDTDTSFGGKAESDSDGVVGGGSGLHHPSMDLSALSDSVFEEYHDDRGRHFSADGDLSYYNDDMNAGEHHYSGAGDSTAGDSDDVGEMVEKVLAAFVDTQKELEEERERRRQLELENEVMRLRIRTLSSVGSNTGGSSRHGSMSYAAALNNGVSSPNYGGLSPRARAMTSAVDTFMPADSGLCAVSSLWFIALRPSTPEGIWWQLGCISAAAKKVKFGVVKLSSTRVANNSS